MTESFPPGTEDEFRTVDHVTGEMHLFAANGANLSVLDGAPDPGPFPPETAVNAVIVAAILDHTYRPPRSEWERDSMTADPEWPGWVNMTPVVTAVYQGPTDPEYCPDHVWVIDVQYHTSGSRALYGVDRNNVPQCYQD